MSITTPTNVVLATYGRPIMCEMHHAEVIRLPLAVAQLVRDRLGAAYSTTGNVARWSASMRTSERPDLIPFELVICNRGASIRCHWSHVPHVSEIVGAMVPDMVVEIVPNVLRVA